MGNKENNQILEQLIGLVQGISQKEGFKTLRFSDTKELGTTAYDCLVLKDSNGKEYTITFDESMRYNDSKGWENTNYIKD